MKNILLTVISLNDAGEQAQTRFNSKLNAFKNALSTCDAEGKKANIKLTAYTKYDTDNIRLEVRAEDPLLRNQIYDHAAHLGS